MDNPGCQSSLWPEDPHYIHYPLVSPLIAIREGGRDHIGITYITVNFYNCPILLLFVLVNLLLCLIYKLGIIIGIYLEGKNIIYIGFNTQFQASIGFLGTNTSPMNKGTTVVRSLCSHSIWKLLPLGEILVPFFFQLVHISFIFFIFFNLNVFAIWIRQFWNNYYRDKNKI